MKKYIFILLYILNSFIGISQNTFPVIKEDNQFKFQRIIYGDTHTFFLHLDTTIFSLNKEKDLIASNDSIKFVGIVIKTKFVDNFNVFEKKGYHMFYDTSDKIVEYYPNSRLLKYKEIYTNTYKTNHYIKYTKDLKNGFCFILAIKGLNNNEISLETENKLDLAFKSKSKYTINQALYNKKSFNETKPKKQRKFWKFWKKK